MFIITHSNYHVTSSRSRIIFVCSNLWSHTSCMVCSNHIMLHALMVYLQWCWICTLKGFSGTYNRTSSQWGSTPALWLANSISLFALDRFVQPLTVAPGLPQGNVVPNNQLLESPAHSSRRGVHGNGCGCGGDVITVALTICRVVIFVISSFMITVIATDHGAMFTRRQVRRNGLDPNLCLATSGLTICLDSQPAGTCIYAYFCIHANQLTLSPAIQQLFPSVTPINMEINSSCN